MKKTQFVFTFQVHFHVLNLSDTKSFSWDHTTNEDLFFCYAAADIFDELPRHIQPAPMTEEIEFSAETIMSPKPFALHQFWHHLPANSPHVAAAMLQNCPEALGIIPQDVLQDNSDWKRIICELDVSYWEASRVDSWCDMWQTCGKTSNASCVQLKDHL